MKERFTSRQVSQRTGLTPRQLQWWDEQGIVVPARMGHRRMYSVRDLAELAVLGDLRRRGVSLQRIRGMISLLRREFGRRLADLMKRGPGLHLLTDGESVYLCDSERSVIDLLHNTRQPLLAICLSPVLERVLAPEVSAARRRGAKQVLATQTSLRDMASEKKTSRVASSKKAASTKVPRGVLVPKKHSQSVRPASAVRARTRS
jgi:DNA-binding transcriptional MerR regulator